jgi:hypothetical protein
MVIQIDPIDPIDPTDPKPSDDCIIRGCPPRGYLRGWGPFHRMESFRHLWVQGKCSPLRISIGQREQRGSCPH